MDDTDCIHLHCRRCGCYGMTSEVWDISAVPPSLRCATRQAFEAGRPLSLDTQNWSTYAQQHEHTSVQENAEKLLLHIARRCPRPGQTETFNQEMDYTVIDCHNEAELVFFVRFLANKGWVDFQASGKWGVTHGRLGAPLRPGRSRLC